MKTILFVCVGNAARSQMAEGFFSQRNENPEIVAKSAGTDAAGFIASTAVELMDEVGIDIRGQSSKQLTPEMVEEADLIVALGCLNHITCPDFLRDARDKVMDWDMQDPYSQPEKRFREIRNEIGRRIQELVDSGL